ncbi:flagellar hook capping FlgD N-terminal domain-containing protein [Yoonia sp. MH D7]
MEISQTTTSSTAQTTAAKIDAGKSAEISSDFETFLKMLTVQMQNQDPLNPVDSSDYAVQLATFSGVEQQVQTNDLLKGLTEILGTNGMAQMAGWVGKEARAPVAAYFDGDPITMAPVPVSFADRAQIVVTDKSGQEVERFDIPLGGEQVSWSGLDSSGFPRDLGLYRFELVSFSGTEAIAQDPVQVYNTVTEVRSQGGETLLLLKGGVTISSGQVSALRDPTL